MNRVQHRRTATAGVVPLITQMLEGEFAINLTDKNVYYCNGTEVIHLNHLVNQKGDSTHRVVTDAQITAWSASQAALGYTPVNRAGDTMTGPFVLTGAAPTLGNEAVTRDYVNALTSTLRGAYRAPVQTVMDLAAVAYASILDKALCLVETEGSLYHYDAESSVVSNGTAVIVPTDSVGTGRWLKVQAATQNHDALSGLTGGAPGDNKHFTTLEKTNVLAHLGQLNLHVTPQQSAWLSDIAMSITALEASSLDGITSNVQGQLEGKQAILGYVPMSRAGDTMTGPLILAGPPVAGNSATTKEYTDNVAHEARVYVDQKVATALAAAELQSTTLVAESQAAAELYSSTQLSQYAAGAILEMDAKVSAQATITETYITTAIAGILYDIEAAYKGVPTQGVPFGSALMARPGHIAPNMGSSIACAGVAPTGTTSFALRRNGIEYARLEFAPGGTVGTFTSALGVSFSRGDMLDFVLISPVDTTFADLYSVIAATRS